MVEQADKMNVKSICHSTRSTNPRAMRTRPDYEMWTRIYLYLMFSSNVLPFGNTVVTFVDIGFKCCLRTLKMHITQFLLELGPDATEVAYTPVL